MKSILVFCIILGIVSADWTPRSAEKMFADQEVCFNSLDIPDDIRQKIKVENYPIDRKVSCYLRCILLGGQVWDDTKGYDAERGHAEILVLGFKSNIENLRKCAVPNTENWDSCQWADTVVRCFAKNNYIDTKSKTKL